MKPERNDSGPGRAAAERLCGWARAALDFGPPLLLMAAIYALGTESASAGATGSLLERWFGAWLSPQEIAVLNAALRKAGHLFGYALLGAFWARALRPRRPGDPGIRSFAAALALSVAWAIVDELHQAFSPERGSSFADVLLDSAGAALGAGLCVWRVLRWLRHPNPNS